MLAEGFVAQAAVDSMYAFWFGLPGSNSHSFRWIISRHSVCTAAQGPQSVAAAPLCNRARRVEILAGASARNRQCTSFAQSPVDHLSHQFRDEPVRSLLLAERP